MVGVGLKRKRFQRCRKRSIRCYRLIGWLWSMSIVVWKSFMFLVMSLEIDLDITIPW